MGAGGLTEPPNTQADWTPGDSGTGSRHVVRMSGFVRGRGEHCNPFLRLGPYCNQRSSVAALDRGAPDHAPAPASLFATPADIGHEVPVLAEWKFVTAAKAKVKDIPNIEISQTVITSDSETWNSPVSLWKCVRWVKEVASVRAHLRPCVRPWEIQPIRICCDREAGNGATCHCQRHGCKDPGSRG